MCTLRDDLPVVCPVRFDTALRAYTLLQAHKHVVMENSAHRNTARFFALRKLDIASAAYITDLQQQINDIIAHIGRCGQVRVMHVCEMIIQQASNSFESWHVWSTCALSGRSTNKTVCVSGSRSRSSADKIGDGRVRRAERMDPDYPLVLDCVPRGPCASVLVHQPALFVDVSFAPFVHALWLCAHVGQVESVRVLDVCLAHVSDDASEPNSRNITMAALFDDVLESGALHDARATTAYEHAFTFALGVLRETARTLDSQVVCSSDNETSPDTARQ